MGCDIHIITQIKADGGWKYIPEVPPSLNTRNYSVFAAIADVRNSFNQCIFKPKGLPDDLGKRKYIFVSESQRQRKRYEERGKVMCICGNGDIISPYDTRGMKQLTKEEYDELDAYSKSNYEEFRKRYASLGRTISGLTTVYHVFDANLVNGYLEEVPFVKLYPTFKDYMATMFDDEWDDEAGDYGYWQVDFDCPDYHSHSYLTLRELLDADYSGYTAKKYKMSKLFYNEFLKAGGILPNKFYIEESTDGDIVDCIAEAINPTVTVCWQPTEWERTNLPLMCGIDELKEIAGKHNISNPENIRIVFAFDN